MTEKKNQKTFVSFLLAIQKTHEKFEKIQPKKHKTFGFHKRSPSIKLISNFLTTPIF